MHYVAVLSLKHTISVYSSDIWFSGEIIDFPYKEVESLEEISKRVFEFSPSRLFEEIIDAAEKLEAAIQFHSSKRIASQSDEERRGDGRNENSEELQDLKQAIDSFTKSVKMIKEKMENRADELYSLPEEEEEDDDDDVFSSRNDSGGQKSKMVGLSNEYNELKSKLIGVYRSTPIEFLALVGMAGIGKTMLAKQIFEDPDIAEHFDCRVWVTVGRKCQLKEIPRRILAELNPHGDQMLAEGDEKIAHHLNESLKGKRYLIVLDDVWDRNIWYHLTIVPYIYGLKRHFLDEGKRSRVLLTTRLQEYGEPLFPGVCKMRLLDKEESWDLLREKVFGEESCPSQLETAGKKIAEYCDGLPLTIVTVANLLSKAERTDEHWNKLAVKRQNSFFMDAYDEISKVLFPSYKYLPQLLQLCFLYMGVFPQNYEIRRSKLFDMWYVDGFLGRRIGNKYRHSRIFLGELVSNSLVMVHQTTISPTPLGSELVKTCRLHSSFWYLSKREAEKNKFYYILNNNNDGLGQGIKMQHRLSFHNNILFGLKEVYKSVEDNCASTTESLLCYGPYHQYQVPICFGLRLLKQLDALTIRFYDFPMEVLQLVELRYLALTMNGKLPASISQLSNLQFLIVGRHLSIRSCRDSSYMPMEIWDMEKLKHVQVMGSDLPDPCGASLRSLSTLSNVSRHSCTKVVFEATPNLVKLGIQIELAPDDDTAKSLGCFEHISHLKNLELLKIVIVNPKAVPPLAVLSNFPSRLQKLSLSGLGYGWEEMSKIASLQFLYVLKLRNCAFRGPKWEVRESFSLYSLIIEDTDLVEWKFGRDNFSRLKCLKIKHCYKLKKIQGLSELLFLEKIEVVDCNPLRVEAMKKDLRRREEAGRIHCSWVMEAEQVC